MGGVATVAKKAFDDVRGKTEERAREAAEKARIEKRNAQAALDTAQRTKGEAEAASRRARRGGLLSTASVVGGEQTLGSGPNL
jgi:hypothetical protein